MTVSRPTQDRPAPRPLPGPGGRAPRGVSWRRRPDWALIAAPALTLAVMLWGLSALPYRGDEADTVSAVSRSLPQLVRLLGHVDAVHGLYYLLLWPVAKVLGTGEFATRLPSAAAMAAAALGVAAIGRRLRPGRAGLCAGLVFAALPMVTVEGHDARPYAMVTAAAVLASHQAVRAASDPRPRRLAAYALSLALLGYLELFGLLLVPAHAIALIALRRQEDVPGHPRRSLRGGHAQALRNRLAQRWLAAASAASAAVTPVVIWGWRQRIMISWIARPSWGDVRYLVVWLAAGSAASVIPVAVLAVLGGCRGDSPALGWPPSPAGPQQQARARRPTLASAAGLGGRPGPGGHALTWLAAPWLLLPPLVLVAVSEIRPIYSFRYVTFCLPAVALLAGTGLAALGWAWRAAALALIVALAGPGQLSMRVPGAGVRAAARVLAAQEWPGDAVVYPGNSIPPWYLAYPQVFGHLRDIGLARSGAAAGHLYGTSVPLPVLISRERSADRIWAVEIGRGWRDPAPYIAPGFRLVRVLRPPNSSVILWLYQRPPSTRRHLASRGARPRPRPVALSSPRPGPGPRTAA